MRIMFGAFGAVLLTASLALGQASQSTSPTAGTTIINAARVTLKLPGLDKTQPIFTATTGTVIARETFLYNVVLQIDGVRYTADRAVINRDGAIRLEGNVRVTSPAPK